MKFGKTYTNKLVSFADRYFTYDKKTMKREHTDISFDFYAFRKENGVYTTVCINRNEYGLWACIRKGDNYIVAKHLKSYQEVASFKKMIRCLS